MSAPPRPEDDRTGHAAFEQCYWSVAAPGRGDPVLGQGGMGTVRLFEHGHLKRRVAVKEIKPENLSDPEFVARFEREAQAAARLMHQNIVYIYDYQKTPRRCLIFMEYVDGVTLRQVMQTGRKIPVLLASYVAREVARGLSHAHRHGLVHRDVKPSNVLLSRRGEVKIGDFGIVKVDDATRDLTQTGAQIGTSHYMSPEQIEGEKVDGRSDVFSLGVVLYEMLCGAHPFGERTTPGQQVGARILRGKFRPARAIRADVPRSLDRVVTRCLQRRPDRRFSGMAAVEQALTDRLWRSDMALAPGALSAFLSSCFPADGAPRALRLPPGAQAPGERLPASRAWRRVRWSALAAGALSAAAGGLALSALLSR